MNEAAIQRRPPVVDEVALALQGLRQAGLGTGYDVLVRIDNRSAEAGAPYQLDAARGVLHRRDCRALPKSAPTFALGRVSEEALSRACKRCKPMIEPTQPKTRERADVLFGLVSLVDQFGSVLKERGKDFRQTPEGRRLDTQLTEVYQGLGAREKEVLDVVLATVNDILARLRSIDGALNREEKKEGD